MKLHTTVTGAPTDLNAVFTACTAVQLSWSAPANNTPPVTGYEVFYVVSGSNSTESGGTTTSTDIMIGLPFLDVTSYDLFVVAYSDAVSTLPSAHSTNITLDLGELKLLMLCSIHLLLTTVQCLLYEINEMVATM